MLPFRPPFQAFALFKQEAWDRQFWLKCRCIRETTDCLSGMSADIALHALGLAGRPGRIEQITRLVRLEPFDRNLGVFVCNTQLGIVDIAAGDALQVLVEST